MERPDGLRVDQGPLDALDRVTSSQEDEGSERIPAGVLNTQGV
jgi:hypothetical protein